MAARRKIEEKHNNDTQQLEIKILVQNHPEEKKERTLSARIKTKP